jgi:hypothetical protein
MKIHVTDYMRSGHIPRLLGAWQKSIQKHLEDTRGIHALTGTDPYQPHFLSIVRLATAKLI